MDSINVKKTDLLEVLNTNRSKHRSIFEDALIGYRKEAIRLLDDALENARNGNKITVRFALTEPMDQTKDYDLAIGMLEMSVDEEIELSPEDYRRYVMDDWEWTDQWTFANSAYTSAV